MNYMYDAITDENDNVVWLVQETQTEQIINSFLFEEDALEYCNFMNRGGGFDGWTPHFMLKQSFIPDINEEFEAFVE